MSEAPGHSSTVSKSINFTSADSRAIRLGGFGGGGGGHHRSRSLKPKSPTRRELKESQPPTLSKSHLEAEIPVDCRFSPKIEGYLGPNSTRVKVRTPAPGPGGRLNKPKARLGPFRLGDARGRSTWYHWHSSQVGPNTEKK